MTLEERLRFAGGVLGPALLAQEVNRLLRLVPAPGPERRRSDAADGLLRQVFPDGLPG